MIRLQYDTFWYHSIIWMLIFIPTLIVVGFLVNYNPCFGYNPNIILRNKEFNVAIATTIVMGLLSLTFARNPRWLNEVISCNPTDSDLSGRHVVTLNCKSRQKQTKNIKSYENRANLSRITRSDEKLGRIVCHLGKDIDILQTEDTSSEIKTNHDVIRSNIKTIKRLLTKPLTRCLPLDGINTLARKSSKMLPKKVLVRSMVGVGGVVLILSPIIIATLFMDLSSDGRSYVYYINLNETKIIQVDRFFGLKFTFSCFYVFPCLGQK